MSNTLRPTASALHVLYVSHIINVKMRGRSWIFTLNNPTENDIQMLQNIPAHFKAYQLEKAPTTGTLHYQGVLIFKEQVTRTKLRRLLRTSWEHTCNNTHAAIAYCTKKSTRIAGPFITGTPPK